MEVVVCDFLDCTQKTVQLPLYSEEKASSHAVWTHNQPWERSMR